MGTIGNALSSYYQLSSLLSSGSGSSLTSSSSASGSSLESLAQILDASGSSNSGGSDGFLLDLSPQAQQLLNGSSSTTSSASGSSSNFVLTKTQETAIENIIEKYKDAPLTQATFEEIQNALQAAGLSPQTLGAEDQVNSFNPTNVLLSALNGNYASISTPAASASSEQTKETNYMKNVLSFWKSIDSGTSSASGSSSSGAASSSSGTGL